MNRMLATRIAMYGIRTNYPNIANLLSEVCCFLSKAQADLFLSPEDWTEVINLYNQLDKIRKEAADRDEPNTPDKKSLPTATKDIMHPVS